MTDFYIKRAKLTCFIKDWELKLVYDILCFLYARVFRKQVVRKSEA